MKRILALAALAILPLGAAPATADDVQPTGPIAVLRVNETTSDDYASFHGILIVGDSVGGYFSYKWGGSHCAGFDLGAPQVEILQRGMNNPRILIEPRTKPGAGGNQCLTAFSLVLRSDTGALP